MIGGAAGGRAAFPIITIDITIRIHICLIVLLVDIAQIVFLHLKNLFGVNVSAKTEISEPKVG